MAKDFLLPIIIFFTLQPAIASAEPLWGAHTLTPIQKMGNGQTRMNLITQQLGMSVMRIGSSWARMEREKGVFNEIYWNSLSQTLEEANQIGLKVIIVMTDTPCWASSDPNKVCSSDPSIQKYNQYYPPENPKDYANAMKKLVKRFGDKVYAWEIWNEPNIDFFSPGHGFRNYVGFWPSVKESRVYLIRLTAAEQYAELLKVSYTAIKSISKEAIVLGGSIAAGDTHFLNKLYQAGIKGSFDALAIHPYSAVTDTGAVDDVDGCNRPPWCLKQGVQAVRDLMINVYNDDTPVWLTEIGVSSFDGWGGVTEQEQDDFYNKTREFIDQQPYVPVVVWFNLVDQNAQTSREGGFGIFRHDLSRKPITDSFALDNSGVPSGTEVKTTYPKSEINYRRPRFYWNAVEGASSYLLWMNYYGRLADSSDDQAGLIDVLLTPEQANCSDGTGICHYRPLRDLEEGDMQWWVTAEVAGDSYISKGINFSIEAKLDSDNDGVPDTEDNCIYHSNFGQRDFDFDGYGNRCDPDYDNDGIVSSIDLIYLNSRLNQRDLNVDITGNGTVESDDEKILRSMLNSQPGPSCCAEGADSWLD